MLFNYQNFICIGKNVSYSYFTQIQSQLKHSYHNQHKSITLQKHRDIEMEEMQFESQL